MANIDKIEEYNNGTLWPEKYDETYIATKHIQSYPLELKDGLVSELKNEVEAAGLFFDDPDLLKEIATGLIRGNIILQGPPGTGKTTLAAIICKVFNVNFDIITAVSDWTTYDTIGGLQPSVDDEGNEIIVGKNGRIIDSIVNCCNTVLDKEQHSGEKQASWLIVDELNRSEIDKVFGDLFTVFGSDDVANRKIPLWFETDENKKTLYVPLRYRIIGLMNNFDKNYVFDLSHGLARRFTIISVLPPAESKMVEEIDNCKMLISNHLPNKVEKIGSVVVDSGFITSLLSDTTFRNHEDTVITLLKKIRYEGEGRLALQFGTAQIIDLYENIAIQMILDDYISMSDDEKESGIKRILDAAVNDRIMPQLDGAEYLKLKHFYDDVTGDTDFTWFEKSIRTLKTIV